MTNGQFVTILKRLKDYVPRRSDGFGDDTDFTEGFNSCRGVFLYKIDKLITELGGDIGV